MNRRGFLDLVASALRESGRPEITRVDTVFADLDDPSGLRIAMADGDVLLLRVLNTSARRVTPGPPLPPSGGERR